MKKLLVLCAILTITGCSSNEVRPEKETRCMDTCSEQGLKMWAAKDDGVCECYTPPTREFGPRGHDRN